jgi:hypothetical protein
VIELLKGQQGGEEGFTFFGFNLQCSLSPARLINYIIKDLGGRGRDQPVSCWESIFNFGVQSVTFRERKPTQDKEPMYMRILSQSGDAKKEGAFQAKDPSLVSVQLYHRYVVICLFVYLLLFVWEVEWDILFIRSSSFFF